MKYLVIGDANSMHIYNYVKSVLLPRKYEIYLLTLSIRPINAMYMEDYLNNGIRVLSIAEKYHGSGKNGSIHRLIFLVQKVLLMRDVPRVDICHVHSVYKTSINIVRLFRRKYKHLILSYWGGDIENKSKYVINIRKKAFQIADRITVTVDYTIEQFHEIYGNVYDNKLSVCRFATRGLELIKELSSECSKSDCKKFYNIPVDSICITCGYSAYPDQHQDECIRQISLLPQEIKERLFIIIPMQYGRFNMNYIELVRNIAKSSGIRYQILEEYVDFKTSAKLAIATDIYLHLRDTDAFSNALKEQIFAGSTVIKGDWLIYRELEKMHASVISLQSMSELHFVLQKMLVDFEIENNINLFLPIYNMYSEDIIRQQWYTIIDGIRN